jgi:YbgC/YbaW family acyl-CoA thioester hydrolase
VSEVFRTEIKVRFADVDDARVVYYPQYLDYCHVAFEDGMEAGFGRPYAEIFRDESVGFPAVNLNVDYSAPSRFGDVLQVAVNCTRLGEKSVVVRYRMVRARDGVSCADARVTVACVDMETFRAMPHPERFRAFFARYLDESESEELS